MARRKRMLIAGAAIGAVAAVAVTTTTLALQGNNSTTNTNVAGNAGPSTPGGGGSAAGGGSSQPGSTPGSTGASAPGSPTPTTSGTTTSPAGNPTTTTPAGNPTTTNPPTTTPPTTKPPTTPPPPAVITVAATSPNPVTGTCPATLSAMTVNGTISSDRATTVTYHWARSNGTSSGSVSKSVAAGGSVSASDSVTPASNNWEIADTLTVTSPSSHSSSAKVAVQCSYPALTITAPTNTPQTGNTGFAITPITVTAGGGNGHYTFALSSPRGNLPAGVSIDPATGTVSGTPTQVAVYDLVITVTDTEATPQSVSTKPFFLTINGN